MRGACRNITVATLKLSIRKHQEQNEIANSHSPVVLVSETVVRYTLARQQLDKRKHIMKVINTLLVLFAVSLLTACDPGPLSAAQTADLGTTDIPGKTGYAFHGYTIKMQNGTIHYVYVVEKDGTPVAGTTASYAAGKATETTSTLVDAPSPALTEASQVAGQFHCDGLAGCKAALQKAEELASTPFHCDSVEECTTKLQNIQKTQ
jgi:hypothetical protein